MVLIKPQQKQIIVLFNTLSDVQVCVFLTSVNKYLIGVVSPDVGISFDDFVYALIAIFCCF